MHAAPVRGCPDSIASLPATRLCHGDLSPATSNDLREASTVRRPTDTFCFTSIVGVRSHHRICVPLPCKPNGILEHFPESNASRTKRRT